MYFLFFKVFSFVERRHFFSMKIKLLQELNPSQRTLKAISSTHPYKIQITSGKINVLEPTNIETIIPIRYLLFYKTKIIEFYEYPENLV